MANESSFDPRAEGWLPYTDDGFIGLIGPLWTREEDGAPRFAFLADARHKNRRGVVQGGMMMTLADRAIGMTVSHATAQQPEATIQLDVHFVDAVHIGEFVEVHCEIVRRTRTLVFITATLMIGDRIVMTAHGIWKLLKPES